MKWLTRKWLAGWLAVPLVIVAATACGGRAGKRQVLQNKGSDTLVNVAQAWAEAYKDVNPALAIAVTGGGSGTGIAALINGTVDLANASRKMKRNEIDAAAKNGIEAVEFVVGFDALAVYVHEDNPIESITLAQLAEIYGEGGEITKWSQLGITMPDEKSDEIILFSRQNNSGTYAYFKSAVLGKQREYKLGTRDLHGSKDVVEAAERTPGGIGYSGLAYATEHVKLVRVAVEKGAAAVVPSITSAVDGTYPIARPLMMYSRGVPTGNVKEYLDWILSPAGQEIIVAKGYAPAARQAGE